MEYHKISFEQRIKENIKNYQLDTLFSVELVKACFEDLAELIEASFLLTDRHGEKVSGVGACLEMEPNVVDNPGTKIRVKDRTFAHLYLDFGSENEEQRHKKAASFANLVLLVEKMGEEAYLRKELDAYSNELERTVEKEKYRPTHGDKEDPLTGFLNKSNFDIKRQIVDRAEMVPVAEICLNINDWKYAYDHFGNEESDRLIRTIADIIRKNAKPEYIIGRTDGDVFSVLINMPQEDEAQAFCEAVASQCNAYEDDKLAPSVAYGIVLKTNVEESLEELYSDAEYEMFDHKYRVKNEPGYRERLEKA